MPSAKSAVRVILFGSAIGLHLGFAAPRPGRADANILSPKLCFAVMIPGPWVPGHDAGIYRSEDGKQAVGVLPRSADELKKFKGGNLVEKEAASLQKDYQEWFGKLTEPRLTAFESGVTGTWKWTAVASKASHNPLPSVFIIDLSPEGIIALTIDGVSDEDSLARKILANLRISRTRPCELPKSTDELLKKLPPAQ